MPGAPKPKAKSVRTKRLNLALQGGGSHGAFAWGVLDAFLEDGRVRFDGVCATSAGAVNAVALAYGLSTGNAETARRTLENLWRQISRLGSVFAPPEAFRWNLPGQDAARYSLLETMSNIVSPYQFNPLNLNPLRRALIETVDVDSLRHFDKVKLFITATDVQTGRPKVFRNDDMSLEVVLASACLPFLFQAVKIKGRAYWDGGYVGNPALWPLFYETDTSDLCVVHLNPLERTQIPTTPYEIDNRINEISFNASLLAELRAVAFVKELIEKDWLRAAYKKKLKDIRVHAIRADHAFKRLSIGSKFRTDWTFLKGLRDRGRSAAHHWLHTNFKAIGKRDTIDLHDEFLDTEA